MLGWGVAECPECGVDTVVPSQSARKMMCANCLAKSGYSTGVGGPVMTLAGPMNFDATVSAEAIFAEVRRLWMLSTAGDRSNKQIGEEFGLSESRVSELLRGRAPKNAAKKAMVLELADKGITVREIERQTGVPRSIAQRWIRRA
jgi:hypothetical protein